MHTYSKKLKPLARELRKNQTDAENRLWYFLREKGLNNIKFTRQKPIGAYIVDFYAHEPKLVIEIDGGQHYEDKNLAYDAKRDRFLKNLGLNVLRFTNLQVLLEVENVFEAIVKVISSRG